MKKLTLLFFLLFTVFNLLFSRPVFAQARPPAMQSCSTCNPSCQAGRQCLTDGIGGCGCFVIGATPPAGQACASCSGLCSGATQCLTDGKGGCSCSVRPGGGAGAGTCTNPGIFGCIINPLPTSNPAPGGGLIQLLNNLLRLIFVAGGIYAFIRVVLAGLKFMSAGGDSKAIEAAWNSIWQSILGVVIIISSLALAALMGLVLFGDATAILQPVIFGP